LAQRRRYAERAPRGESSSVMATPKKSASEDEGKTTEVDDTKKGVEARVSVDEESVEDFVDSIKKEDDDDLLERLRSMEQHAFDPANNLLNRAQFSELLELQSETEPEFMGEIVDMYCVDSQEMLDELKTILLSDDETTEEGYIAARAALHKLRGSSSTLGAEGIQRTCETLRELCVSKEVDKIAKGPDGLEELEKRLDILRVFLKKYVRLSNECTERKLTRSASA
jgi:histidine-containing phosphotransfer protein